MGEHTAISWTNHTFNTHWICTEVSSGCDNCYARTFAHRLGYAWGKDAPRRTFGDAHWNEPLKWNAAAEKAGRPALVFCASMADWCDVDAPEGVLPRLHDLWRRTPWLRWQMLTKRPARIRLCLPSDWGDGYHNVWLGTTVEDRKHGLPRIDVLRAIPARVRFLSMEPLLEDPGVMDLSGISWVIIGGESGHLARPFQEDWARNIIGQCRASGVRCFIKQDSGPRPGQQGKLSPGTWAIKELPDV
jgi:protein gp37